MIKQVVLFTNRNLMAFDEEGRQIGEIQNAIRWERKDDDIERWALEKIISDNPKIYIAKWKEWQHEISIQELCSILGHGRWYLARSDVNDN